MHLRSVYIIISWFICFVYCYSNHIQVIYFIVKPLSVFSPINNPNSGDPYSANTSAAGLDFIYTNINEAFYATLHACFVISLVAILPLVIYQGWCFLMPSRYQWERVLWNTRIWVGAFYITTVMWIILGYLLPRIYIFLHLFAVKSGALRITLEARIAPYLSWIFLSFFLFLLLTLLPMATYIALSNKIISVHNLWKNRRAALYLILILAAFVSPPDIWSQLFLTAFLYMLFECVIWYYLYTHTIHPR